MHARPRGDVEGVQAELRERVAQTLGRTAEGQGCMDVGRWCRRVRRVLAPDAVHLVQLLGPAVVRLELLVADGPAGGEPTVMMKPPEVMKTQPVQGRSKHGRGPAHAVGDERPERSSVTGVPDIGRSPRTASVQRG